MQKITLLLLLLIQFLSNKSIAQSENWVSSRPDGHAPISIMGDHYHSKGQIMFSYRVMSMWMDGNLSGSEKNGNDEIFQNYMVAPQKMNMQMHMLGVMYAPVNAFTLMVMANYISNNMDLRTGMGVGFTTVSSGFGDISLSGLMKILNANRQSLHGILGISIPTGGIDQKDDTPMADNAQLAYPMQLGSGTWDPLIGVTYLGQADLISWGTQLRSKFRLGKNDENYTLGNEFRAVAWGAIKAFDFLSFSCDLNYRTTGKISGADPDLNPMMMPLFNAENSGKNQLDAGIGSNFYVPDGKFKDLRLGIEVNYPLYQNVSGIQMKNVLTGTIALQYTIGH
jgi:hypothetical protein